MNDPFLVPCLVTLRSEFNAVAPGRDKGADGWIGNRAHALSSSDHNPDETGRTPYSDADFVDEVHAVDIDGDGPWPDGRGGQAGGWFDRTIRAIAAQERREFLSTTVFGRLQNIIWRGQIISRSWGWSEWHDYDGPSDHFDHAHFSARYTSAQEADTRPWGVLEDDVTEAELIAAVEKALAGAKGQAAMWNATLAQDRIQGYDSTGAALPENPADPAADDMTVASAITFAARFARVGEAQLAALKAQLAELSAQVGQVDEQTAAAIFGGSTEQLRDVLVDALGRARAAELGALLTAPAA
ncbi:hypothetical protein [Actinoplanes palleronii]|uniref:Uncharacterized protein n=1 Tax=Actinoplanes palleronii TaxID=113570 RepID=A0ABQ4B498_9ACTN|nr:hypothetical protein [Actinoplanes palleronii]GIE65412.1 hypothetical protein Apa02nite_015200 [Actinoplanes palleronii]